MTGNALGLQVLEALGLDPASVRAVQINMEVNQAATVQVTRFIYDEEARQMVDHLALYRIEPAKAIGERDEQPDDD